MNKWSKICFLSSINFIFFGLFRAYAESGYIDPNVMADSNFVTIKAGTFTMGSRKAGDIIYDDEIPSHKVTITKDFQMQKTTVTQEQYAKILGVNNSKYNYKENCPNDFYIIEPNNPRYLNEFRVCPRNPVDTIWYSYAIDFAHKLNKLDNRYFYRLPTEVEWEYSARAGTESLYWFGDDPNQLSNHEWTSENSGDSPQAVATKLPNPWGLYDMLGNVYQWVSDWSSGPTTPYPSSEHQFDPQGPSEPFDEGRQRVVRGCTFYDGPLGCRVAIRKGALTSFKDYNSYIGPVGFRLVRIPR